METNKLTNEELKNELKRLEEVFNSCKEKMKILADTMNKASEQYGKINEELKKRNCDE